MSHAEHISKAYRSLDKVLSRPGKPQHEHKPLVLTTQVSSEAHKPSDAPAMSHAYEGRPQREGDHMHSIIVMKNGGAQADLTYCHKHKHLYIGTMQHNDGVATFGVLNRKGDRPDLVKSRHTLQIMKQIHTEIVKRSPRVVSTHPANGKVARLMANAGAKAKQYYLGTTRPGGRSTGYRSGPFRKPIVRSPKDAKEMGTSEPYYDKGLYVAAGKHFMKRFLESIEEEVGMRVHLPELDEAAGNIVHVYGTKASHAHPASPTQRSEELAAYFEHSKDQNTYVFHHDTEKSKPKTHKSKDLSPDEMWDSKRGGDKDGNHDHAAIFITNRHMRASMKHCASRKHLHVATIAAHDRGGVKWGPVDPEYQDHEATKSALNAIGRVAIDKGVKSISTTPANHKVAKLFKAMNGRRLSYDFSDNSVKVKQIGQIGKSSLSIPDGNYVASTKRFRKKLLTTESLEEFAQRNQLDEAEAEYKIFSTGDQFKPGTPRTHPDNNPDRQYFEKTGDQSTHIHLGDNHRALAKERWTADGRMTHKYHTHQHVHIVNEHGRADITICHTRKNAHVNWLGAHHEVHNYGQGSSARDPNPEKAAHLLKGVLKVANNAGMKTISAHPINRKVSVLFKKLKGKRVTDSIGTGLNVGNISTSGSYRGATHDEKNWDGKLHVARLAQLKRKTMFEAEELIEETALDEAKFVHKVYDDPDEFENVTMGHGLGNVPDGEVHIHSRDAGVPSTAKGHDHHDVTIANSHGYVVMDVCKTRKTGHVNMMSSYHAEKHGYIGPDVSGHPGAKDSGKGRELLSGVAHVAKHFGLKTITTSPANHKVARLFKTLKGKRLVKAGKPGEKQASVKGISHVSPDGSNYDIAGAHSGKFVVSTKRIAKHALRESPRVRGRFKGIGE